MANVKDEGLEGGNMGMNADVVEWGIVLLIGSCPALYTTREGQEMALARRRRMLASRGRCQAAYAEMVRDWRIKTMFR